MKFTFWGTRGSIPAPGPHTVAVGGNTTCLEIDTEGATRIIVDAGTGIRALGLKLLKETNPEPITLLLTHSHWDHLAGFTFFAPAYSSKFKLDVYGNHMAQEVLQRDIFERHDNRYFPVNMDDFRAYIKFFDEMPNVMRIGKIRIRQINLNHPGNGFGYRFDKNNHSMAFITDNEIGLEYKGGNTTVELIEFCRGCNILIHDAQFLPEEIATHRGWGHSTYTEIADIAAGAGVKHIILTHHDPERDDQSCWDLLQAAREYLSRRDLDIGCDLAIEGQSYTF
ncbi:MAG: MBL fold metallo-hydrolase [Calditrichaeota bacterium]|nr:MBL fold metallo-hydrolase [Calditrichota bacterium]